MVTMIPSHIYLDDEGVAWIEDANTKVVEVVMDKIAYHLSAEQIHAEHPHLSMAQIHAALAYFFDHQDEIERDIARRIEYVNALEQIIQQPAIRERLRQLRN